MAASGISNLPNFKSRLRIIQGLEKNTKTGCGKTPSFQNF